MATVSTTQVAGIVELLNASLAATDGADCTLWRYVAESAALELRLARPGVQEGIHVICSGVRTLQLPARVGGVNLRASLSRGEYTLEDLAAGILIRCGEIYLQEGVTPGSSVLR
jgi:hypothetical protein